LIVKAEIPDNIAQVFEENENIGRYSLAELLAISDPEARFYAKLWKNKVEDNTNINISQDGNSLTVETNLVDSLDKVLELAKVDLSKWFIEKHNINYWSSTDGNQRALVKIWLKPKIIQPIEQAIRELIKELPKHKPVYASGIMTTDRNLMLEVSLFDVHFGMLAWDKETGNDYDIEIAERLYVDTVKKILERVTNFNISKILFPLGNDFFHVNNPEGLTPKARNFLDVDSRLPKIYKAGKMAIIKAIDYCLGIAPVHILWIPGNHDPETSFFLVDAIREHYSSTDRVEVDVSPKARKYIQWGKCMIGFTHGDEEPHRDLPSIMASEEKDMWSKTDYREWHIGHFHKRKEMKFISGDSFQGMVVRTLLSISGTDNWHYRKGYINKFRAGEAFLWDTDEGMINNIIVNSGG